MSFLRDICTSHMFFNVWIFLSILKVADLVEYTHTLHKCEKYLKGNVFRVIINILSESGLISCSFTLDNTSPTTVNYLCFSGTNVCLNSVRVSLPQPSPIYMTTLHPKTQTYFLCLVTLTQQRKTENLKIFYNLDLVFFHQNDTFSSA